MNELEQILRNQIGNLVLENAKLQATLMQLQKEIEQLKAKKPDETDPS